MFGVMHLLLCVRSLCVYRIRTIIEQRAILIQISVHRFLHLLSILSSVFQLLQVQLIRISSDKIPQELILNTSVITAYTFFFDGEYDNGYTIEYEYDNSLMHGDELDRGKLYSKAHHDLKEKLQPLADKTNMFFVVIGPLEVIGYPLMVIPSKYQWHLRDLTLNYSK